MLSIFSLFHSKRIYISLSLSLCLPFTAHMYKESTKQCMTVFKIGFPFSFEVVLKKKNSFTYTHSYKTFRQVRARVCASERIREC